MTVCAGMLYEIVDRGHESKCWIWIGPTRNGKALLRVGGRYEYAYRHFWSIANGSLDSQTSLMRQCGETLCANPQHYRPSRRVLGLPPKEPPTPEKHRAWNLRKYGLTIADYDALLAAQEGVCAVCKRDSRDKLGRRLHVDHDHLTGCVRGLLCTRCNNAIGQAGEDAARLRDLASYLERSASSL